MRLAAAPAASTIAAAAIFPSPLVGEVAGEAGQRGPPRASAAVQRPKAPTIIIPDKEGEADRRSGTQRKNPRRRRGSSVVNPG